MKKRITQCDRVLKHLETHKKGITPATAWERYGIQRLSGRIFELREMGYEIETLSETKKNRYGVPCTYARYILKG